MAVFSQIKRIICQAVLRLFLSRTINPTVTNSLWRSGEKQIRQNLHAGIFPLRQSPYAAGFPAID